MTTLVFVLELLQMDIVVYVYLHMYLHLIAVTRSDICLSFIGSSVMEGKLKFVVHGRNKE